MTDPKLTELLSVCRRLIEDGVLLDSEVQYLKRWLQENPRIASRFPGQQIAARLQRIFADGAITEDERIELLSLLRKAARDSTPRPASTAPPVEWTFDASLPEVEFMNRHFCLAGQFYCGSFRWCKHQVEKRGGDAQPELNPSTDYLVIGAVGGPDPADMRKAGQFRERLRIIPEAHWLRFLT
ncbi:MAG: hypothetical protein FJ398_18000 [Verrucomicrobia bacterium]|nr:hypothetical protein [Verrucomicrobiota bacterium]